MVREKPKVTIIIPTYNEHNTITDIIKDILKFKEQYILEIIVADGGSKDNTVQLAKRERVKVIQNKKKRGKGIDFWEAALKAKGDYIVQIDADYQFSPKEIPLFIDQLQKEADVALGWRTKHHLTPTIRTFGNAIFSIFTSIILQRRLHDIVAGFKGFRSPVLRSLNLQDAHFGYEGEIVVKSARMGYKIVEVPVTYQNRVAGKSQVNALRDGFLTIYSILKARVMPLPTNNHK